MGVVGDARRIRLYTILVKEERKKGKPCMEKSEARVETGETEVEASKLNPTKEQKRSGMLTTLRDCNNSPQRSGDTKSQKKWKRLDVGKKVWKDKENVSAARRKITERDACVEADIMDIDGEVGVTKKKQLLMNEIKVGPGGQAHQSP